MEVGEFRVLLLFRLCLIELRLDLRRLRLIRKQIQGGIRNYYGPEILNISSIIYIVRLQIPDKFLKRLLKFKNYLQYEFNDYSYVELLVATKGSEKG